MAVIFKNVDQLIREGQHLKAKSLLNTVKLSEIPRDQLVQVSDFGIRLKDPLFSLKVLARVMKNHHEGIESARPDEIVSYTKALIKMGFFKEAERWMAKLDTTQKHEIHNLKSRLRISQWDYQGAIHSLKRYQSGLKDNPYLLLVNSLNLASALTYVKDYEQATEILQATLEQATRANHKIIIINCHELLGQVCIMSGQFEEGQQHLEKSLTQLGQQKNIYSFYGKKWLWIARLNSGNDKGKIISEGHTLRNQAEESGFLEDIRDIDRRLAIATNNRELGLHVYHGTFYKSFKGILKSELFANEEIPHQHIWNLNQIDSKAPRFAVEDLPKRQENPRKIFQVLTLDFYRPLSTGHLFSELFPDEYFDPFSSPTRLYQNIQQLRSSLPEGLIVNYSQDGVSLGAKKPFQIIVSHNGRNSNTSPSVRQLRGQMKRSWFTTKDVATVLSISQRSAQRLIKKSSEDYKIESQGQGRTKRYRFAG